MVMPDPNASFQELPLQHQNENPVRFTARPVDRLAAQIFDLSLVMAPIFLLLTAPFKVMLYHGFLVENQEEILLSGIAHVCIGVVIFVSYHFLCNFYFQTTIGKYLFRLQIVDVWTGKPLNAWRSLGRSVISGLSFLTLGLAFLPILSNDRRRSVADLCFDCEVVSRKTTHDHAPGMQERYLVRAVYSLTALLGLILVVGLCGSVLNYSSSQEDITAWFMDRASKCEAIDDAMAEWPVNKGERKANRLRVSLALYAAGMVDRKCLQAEADSEATFSSAPGSLYYLAQSFAHSDETSVSDSYLEQVCQQDAKSSSCELSQIVNAWSVEDWQKMDAAFDRMKHPDVVAAVWAIRHFMKQGQPEKAFAWIKRVSPNKSLGAFLQVQRVKALWLMSHRAEAQIGALQALESLPEEWQVDLASWMCTQETSLECKKGVSLSCGWLNQQSLTAQDDPGLAVAMLRAKECSEEKMDYREVAELSDLSAWPDLVKVAEEEKSGHKKEAFRLVKKIMHDKDQPEDFRLEAYRRFMDLADDQSMLDATHEMKRLPDDMWRELEPRVTMELSRREPSHRDRLPASVKEGQ